MFNAVGMIDAMTFNISNTTKDMNINAYVWETQANLTDIDFLWSNSRNYTNTSIGCLNMNATNIIGSSG